MKIAGLVLVNIGCGKTLHLTWVNMDVALTSPAVHPIDARKPLLFANDAVDACYDSHILEHLDQPDAKSSLTEYSRILKPKSVLRVVVPDLGEIVREYIRQLDQAVANRAEICERYAWIPLELLHQPLCDQSGGGGQMANRIREASPALRAHIKERVDKDAEGFLTATNAHTSLASRLIQPGAFLKMASSAHQKVVKLIQGLIARKTMLRLTSSGHFRMSGEVHRWVYNHFSLGVLLRESGFDHIRVRTTFKGDIHYFNSYSLDVAKGNPRQPDSVFMEAMSGRKVQMWT